MKRLALVLSLAFMFGIFAANAQDKPATNKATTEQTTKKAEKKKVVKKKPAKKAAKSTTTTTKDAKTETK